MEAQDRGHTRVTYRLLARGGDAERVGRARPGSLPASG
jgi:hypothetical protein